MNLNIANSCSSSSPPPPPPPRSTQPHYSGQGLQDLQWVNSHYACGGYAVVILFFQNLKL